MGRKEGQCSQESRVSSGHEGPWRRWERTLSCGSPGPRHEPCSPGDGGGRQRGAGGRERQEGPLPASSGARIKPPERVSISRGGKTPQSSPWRQSHRGEHTLQAGAGGTGHGAPGGAHLQLTAREDQVHRTSAPGLGAACAGVGTPAPTTGTHEDLWWVCNKRNGDARDARKGLGQRSHRRGDSSQCPAFSNHWAGTEGDRHTH